MKEYHKIQTIYFRDPEAKNKTLLEGQYSLPEFEYLKDNTWVFTEKVDGTNIRVMKQYPGDQSLLFMGKTDNAQIPALLVSRLRAIFDPMMGKFNSVFGEDVDLVCLYGEGYGAKIQKGGGNYGPCQDFVLFDVKVGDWWLRREDVEDVASKLGLDVVPIIGTGTLGDMVERCREGFGSQWGDFIAEGIVARPATELFARNGQRIITKLKHKDFRR